MDLLLLPIAAFCDVVGDRLNLKELVRLDSAFCCQNRDVWLELVKSKQFTFHAPVAIARVRQVQWLLLRDIKVSNIAFEYRMEEATTRMISTYLRMYASSIRTACFAFVDGTLEMNLTAVHCRNLLKLSVANAVLTTAFTSVLQVNPNIQHMLCDNVGSRQRDLMEGLSFHKLQTFRVYDCDGGTTPGWLWHETTHSTSLHTVIWDNCSFKYEDWKALIANCPQLRSLAWNFVARGVCLLAEYVSMLARIVNLSCSDNHTFTDASILTISKNLTSLRTLNIQKCANLTDMTLLHITEHSGTTLEVLYVDIHNPESKETGQILETFSQQCTKLEYLNINCGEKVLCAGHGTSLLVRGCPALRTLVVNKQETICESSRDFIAVMRPELELWVQNGSTKYDILSMPI